MTSNNRSKILIIILRNLRVTRYCAVFCQNSFFPELECSVQTDLAKVEYVDANGNTQLYDRFFVYHPPEHKVFANQNATDNDVNYQRCLDRANHIPPGNLGS